MVPRLDETAVMAASRAEIVDSALLEAEMTLSLIPRALVLAVARLRVSLSFAVFPAPT